MKTLTIKTLALATGMALMTSGCTGSFDSVNDNPNSPTSVSPQYLLTYALEKSIDRYWGSNTRFERLNLDAAELWIQHLGRNIYSNEGDNYEASQALMLNNWQSFFNDSQLNLQRILTITDEKGSNPHANYYGVALVMRTWVFSVLTDTFGAIPYSQALQGGTDAPVLTPKYDAQEQVYTQMLADLKTANEKLSVTGPAIAGDIVYNGSVLKWKKFANSLRLRLANRQAAKKPAESRAIMKEILSDPTTYPIFTSNDDNASLKTTTSRPSNNEWNETMIWGSRTDWNLSQTLVDKLVALNDPRLGVYGSQQGGVWLGVPNGLPDAIATTYLARAAKIGTAFTKADAPEVIMTWSELNFILAEAAIDGDIEGGATVAKEYFEKGVNASMTQYGVTAPASYFTTVGTVTREKILDQKWICLFANGVEAWAEWRRTGLPVFPAKDPRSVFANDGVLPTRLPYPGSEASLNATNMKEGISLNGGTDDFKTKLWWAEK
ncbi:SusD/RagB family nutrient-binding outer membrane lipoprotein [Siphonobacter sp. BAB-5405]|uniref:SusD/RagB family nutrient-binding outer membrane lipoprotein n=1 Tax=Siphonobacter sp. BAB-5405 TaxID=1864825 RepID=UPI000C809562|nr:SusD/RagB family nutrient-binding outer membrane lipoprotein [Siphonobacter sp. BAB-5405]PMD96966.1 SusD/RagB family nutrient-binding outer membrane lipoprotein [Siphonobacter sp. BAB-5405]